MSRQICILRLDNPDSFLPGLDDATTAPAWPGSESSRKSPSAPKQISEHPSSPLLTARGTKASADVSKRIQQCLKAITAALIIYEEKLNQLDSGCGDGDCGTTLRHLADAIDCKTHDLNFQYPATLAAQLAAVAASVMGGTSGAIYSLFLTYAGEALTAVRDFGSADVWGSVWRRGLIGVQKYSRARKGDRTMVKVEKEKKGFLAFPLF